MRSSLKNVQKFLKYMNKNKDNLSINIDNLPKVLGISKKGSQFIQGCKLGNLKLVKRLWEENPNYMFNQDHFKLTGLHWAIKRRQYQIVKFLCLKNIHLETKDFWGNTPLYYAVLNKFEEIVEILLKNGASPWSTNEKFNLKNLAQNHVAILNLLKKYRLKSMARKICFN